MVATPYAALHGASHSVVCSDIVQAFSKMAVPMGFEPTISCVTGKRGRPDSSNGPGISWIVELPPTIDGISTNPITLLDEPTAHAEDFIKVFRKQEVRARLRAISLQPSHPFL